MRNRVVKGVMEAVERGEPAGFPFEEIARGFKKIGEQTEERAPVGDNPTSTEHEYHEQPREAEIDELVTESG